jgi:hypothetical protein
MAGAKGRIFHPAAYSIPSNMVANNIGPSVGPIALGPIGSSGPFAPAPLPAPSFLTGAPTGFAAPMGQAPQIFAPTGPGATMMYPSGATSNLGAYLRGAPSGQTSIVAPWAQGASMRANVGNAMSVNPLMRPPSGFAAPGGFAAPNTPRITPPSRLPSATPAANNAAAPASARILAPPAGAAQPPPGGVAAPSGRAQGPARPGLGTRLIGQMASSARGPVSTAGQWLIQHPRAAALGQGLLWTMGGSLAGQGVEGIAGALGASDSVQNDLGNMARYGVMGAGIGSMFPGVGTALGGAVGAGVGALGFIPGIENTPIIGGLWGGGDDGPSSGSVNEDIRTRTAEVLTMMGASPEFIQRANQQFDIAYTVQGYTRNDDGSWDFHGAKPEEVAQVGEQVLNGMIQQFGLEQNNAASQQQLTAGYDTAQAQILAAQAWMEPLLREQLANAQFYADQYAEAGRAAAGQINDPALAAAATALADQYSSSQASANLQATQQLMPNIIMQQLEQQYNQQLQTLQQQQLNLQQQELQMAQNGMNPYGSSLASGLYPTVGP